MFATKQIHPLPDWKLVSTCACLWTLVAALGTANGQITPPSDAGAAPDREIADQPSFIRVARDEKDEPLALEVAITRYVRANRQGQKVVLDLVGAVHVADRSYFDELNKLFVEYDAVLYELVAPEGTRIPRGGGRGSSGVSVLQSGLVDLLDLDFQLERIDYEKENLVHADMSPDEFAKSMKDRGESVVQMILNVLSKSVARQSQPAEAPTEVDLFAALFAPDRASRLKRILAEQFAGIEVMLAVFSGPQGSTLLTERNKKALRVLDREIKAGKQQLAIFYGCGHILDLHDRLLDEFGFELRSQKWIVAWDLQRVD